MIHELKHGKSPSIPVLSPKEYPEEPNPKQTKKHTQNHEFHAKIGVVEKHPTKADSRSASSKRIKALFPPNSKPTGFSPVAATDIILPPVGPEPVNEILSTIGWDVKAPPASGPKPDNTFNAPAGNPACAHICPRTRHDKGASSEDLRTIVHPAARAGITLTILKLI